MTLSTLRDEVGLDLIAAYDALQQSRAMQRKKDTPEHRQHVADCLEHIDGLLDLILEMQQ